MWKNGQICIFFVLRLNRLVWGCVGDGNTKIGGCHAVGFLEMVDKSRGTLDATHLCNACYGQLGALLQQGDGILHALYLDIAGDVGIGVFLHDGGNGVLVNTFRRL